MLSALDRVERLRLPFQIALRVSSRQHHQLGAVLCLAFALVPEHFVVFSCSTALRAFPNVEED